MAAKEPTSIKEALIAELLSDLNVTIEKAEAVIASANQVDENMKASTTALIVAGEKYKNTVNVFTEETKTALSSHIEDKTAKTLADVINELKTANKAVLSDEVKPKKKAFSLTPFLLGLLVVLNAISIYLSIS